MTTFTSIPMTTMAASTEIRSPRTQSVIKVNSPSHKFWPKWFNLKNYDCLKTITAERFIVQIKERLRLLSLLVTANGQRLTDDRQWQRIRSGEVLIDQWGPEHNFECEAVKLIDHVDIEALYEDISIEDADYEPNYLFPSGGKGQLFLAVDIANADDKVLLSNFNYLLRKLRQHKGISEPKFPRFSKTHIRSFKKLLHYKVIPYLDLMLYCRLYDNPIPRFPSNEQREECWLPLELSQPILATLLFENSIDDEQYKKTYQRFYNKHLKGGKGDELLSMMFAVIRSDEKLTNCAMKDL